MPSAAAPVQMLQGDILDAVCQSLGTQSTYRRIRDKVRYLVATRFLCEDSGPNPVDVGCLMGRYDDGDVE